jgi:hypothetical protein
MSERERVPVTSQKDRERTRERERARDQGDTGREAEASESARARPSGLAWGPRGCDCCGPLLRVVGAARSDAWWREGGRERERARGELWAWHSDSCVVYICVYL